MTRSIMRSFFKYLLAYEKLEPLQRYWKHITDSQHKLNYQGEYDRIRSTYQIDLFYHHQPFNSWKKKETILEGVKIW